MVHSSDRRNQLTLVPVSPRHLLSILNLKKYTFCPVGSAPGADPSPQERAIIGDACSLETKAAVAAGSPSCCSWIEAQRWSPAGGFAAATTPPLDQKASSCRSICAYRSSARWRLLGSASSTRWCPNCRSQGRSSQRWDDPENPGSKSIMAELSDSC